METFLVSGGIAPLQGPLTIAVEVAIVTGIGLFFWHLRHRPYKVTVKMIRAGDNYCRIITSTGVFDLSDTRERVEEIIGVKLNGVELVDVKPHRQVLILRSTCRDLEQLYKLA